MEFRVCRYAEFRDKKLIKEAHKLYNTSFPYDLIDYETFEKMIFEDPNFDEALILFSMNRNDTPTAFLVMSEIVREPREAVDRFRSVIWIKNFALDITLNESLWRKLFVQLIKYCETVAKERGKRTVILYAYPPFYYMPGINLLYEDYLELFNELGYSKEAEAVNYYVDMTQFFYPKRVVRLEERLVKDGFIFRKGEPNEVEELSEWVGKTFGNPFWRIETIFAFRNRPPTIWIAEKNSKIVGFSVYSPIRSNQFGPIGVDPSMRGIGVGTVLLFKSLNDLRYKGFPITIIPWTSHLFFYTQVPGIFRVHHYITLAKSIS